MTDGKGDKLKFYGVLQQNVSDSEVASCLENIKRNGFSVYNPGFSKTVVEEISLACKEIQIKYLARHGQDYLTALDEHNTVRLPMSLDFQSMTKIALDENLLSIVGSLIEGSYILNQQNLISNPSQQDYNQSSWHRDLPYQHFTSSTPLAINAIYCVDDFTLQNGASYVLPFSHKENNFPSDHYIESHETQVEAPAGSYIILDCMTYHRGGFNQTATTRRAINQVFTIPYFRQQISIPNSVLVDSLDHGVQKILGVNSETPSSIEGFLDSRDSN